MYIKQLGVISILFLSFELIAQPGRSYYQYIKTLPPEAPDQHSQRNPTHEQAGDEHHACYENECDSCCCECTVEPQFSCDEPTCYNPSFHDLRCDWGASIQLEFLYWYAKETNLPYAARLPMIETQIDPADPFFTSLTTGVGERKYLDTSWDPGFRLGIGFNSRCDGWDYRLTWTWFKNKQQNSTSVDNFFIQVDSNSSFALGSSGQTILINPWVNAALGNETWDRIQAKYRLRLNQIDLVLGRRYWVSPCLTVRPFIGLRGAWTDVRFAVNSKREFTSTAFQLDNTTVLTYQDRFTTRAWGVGIIGGLEPTWYFTRCFALYGEVGVGALWGEFEIKKREKFVVTSSMPALTNSYRDSGKKQQTQMTPLLDLGLGLRCERTWCCERFRTALDLGWEHHVYFDQNHRDKTYGTFQIEVEGSGENMVEATGYERFNEATGNLGFGGFVLRLALDF